VACPRQALDRVSATMRLTYPVGGTLHTVLYDNNETLSVR
jgi:hypothetical protein